MDLICGVPHPMAELVNRDSGTTTEPETSNGSLAPSSDSSSAPCRFTTVTTPNCTTRVCTTHADGKCVDVTAHYYNPRTGRLLG